LKFSYDNIETQIIEVLPELKPVADNYWKDEGKEGEDSGAYVFLGSIFESYVDFLLAMPESPGRNRLLSRAFNLVEDMMKSEDEAVSGLAIDVLESRGNWFNYHAFHFFGPLAYKYLDEWQPGWREKMKLGVEKKLYEPLLIDLYNVREVIYRELKSEGITIEDVPRETDNKTR
jgi:hypothetical protein